MIAKVREYDFNQVSNQIDRLISLVESRDNMKIVSMMKRIVPEFKSENSIYEELDNVKKQENSAELSSNNDYEIKQPAIDENGHLPQDFDTSIYTKNKSFQIGKKFSLLH